MFAESSAALAASHASSFGVSKARRMNLVIPAPITATLRAIVIPLLESPPRRLWSGRRATTAPGRLWRAPTDADRLARGVAAPVRRFGKGRRLQKRSEERRVGKE